VIRNYKTDLPIQKGLSSSAAICVLTARAFNRLYDLGLTTWDEMELAYQGEVTTPSRCGRMDQGCAFGKRPVLMTFDGDRLEASELTLGQDMHLVIADLQAHKDTQRILAQLNRCYPLADTAVKQGVQELLGPINKRIVHQAVAALHLLDYGPLQPHIWGGKGVGSQGDGAAQLVARSQADQRAIIEMLERDMELPALALTIHRQRPRVPDLAPGERSGPRP